MLKTTLVVPCYNEAQRFPLSVFTAFIEQHLNISLVVVNDGSTDDTSLMLEKLRATNPLRIQVIDRVENRGKAESVREGMLAALAATEKPDVIGLWDADLATPLQAVFDMLPKLEDRSTLQMVFGARVALLGREIHRKPQRHYLGRIFAAAVSAMLRLPVYDTQCGGKLFRLGPLTPQLFQEPFCSRWVFDVEIIARWLRANRYDRNLVKSTIYELPLHQWEDVGGSKVKPYDFILAFRDVLRIYQRYF
jgi:dolichyl-phosphate beta-glucosyltransferase